MRRLESVDIVDNPHHVALWASAVLAADKGIPSDVEPVNCARGPGYDVVADNGSVFRFLQK